MKNVLFLVLVLVLALSVGAQALTWMVESRATATAGQGFGYFSISGAWSDVTGGSSATGVTAGLGQKYSAGYTGRSATYKYTPATTGYYDVFSTWVKSTTNHTDIKFTVTNAGTSLVVYKNQAAQSGADMGGTWVTLATGLKLLGSTSYSVTQTANTSVSSINQRAQATKWVSKIPTAATLSGIADGATGVAWTGTSLTWTAGSYNSQYNVYFGTDPASIPIVASNLVEGTLSYALPTLEPSTQYYWKVLAKNADVSATSAVRSFTTVVPEPGTVVAAMALLAPAGLIIRRRRV